MPEDALAAVYADMVFAKELYRGNPAKYEKTLDSLLDAHGTDTTVIRNSFAYYADDPETLNAIYQKAVERTERYAERDTASAAPDTLSAERDTSGI